MPLNESPANKRDERFTLMSGIKHVKALLELEAEDTFTSAWRHIRCWLPTVTSRMVIVHEMIRISERAWDRHTGLCENTKRLLLHKQ